MVAAKVPDDLLKIDRQVHRLLVDGEMLIPGHRSYRPKKTGAGGKPPLHPPKAK